MDAFEKVDMMHLLLRIHTFHLKHMEYILIDAQPFWSAQICSNMCKQ